MIDNSQDDEMNPYVLTLCGERLLPNLPRERLVNYHPRTIDTRPPPNYAILEQEHQIRAPGPSKYNIAPFPHGSLVLRARVKSH